MACKAIVCTTVQTLTHIAGNGIMEAYPCPSKGFLPPTQAKYL